MTTLPLCENFKVRIVADFGKAITKNGEDLFTVVEDYNDLGWYEVDAPNEFLPTGDLY
jgi:hypothetical protein